MSQTDANTTLNYLRKIIHQFVNERDWEQFHSPKNLSMAIAIEAAELMEHFQWLDVAQSRELNESTKKEIGEELADVICYSLALTNQLNIDLTSTVLAKIAKNRKKYPVSEFRGVFRREEG